MNSILEEMKQAYYDNYTDYSATADAIVEDLQSFFTHFQRAHRLQIKQYPLYRFESRIKSWDSIADKIERKVEYRGARSLNDLHDIIGIYIIVELVEDVDKVVKLFEKEKIFLLTESHITSLQYSPTRHENGFVSIHYDGVYSLKAASANAIYNFEIQVRSEVENLWSNIEHMSFYKNRAKNRNDRILNRLKEHSYNLLLQSDDVLNILRRERMKNDLLDLKEKMMEALEGTFDGVKIRDVEAISGYMYECWELPFDIITVEEFEHIFDLAARVKDDQVTEVLDNYITNEQHQRLFYYLKNNMSLSDSIILKIGISSGEDGAAMDYLLSDMEEVSCSACKQWLDYNDADFFASNVEMRGDFYCRDCAEKKLNTCNICGSVMTTGKVCMACTSKFAKKKPGK